MLRMAAASLREPDSPKGLLAEVRRLYQVLAQLPQQEKPWNEGGRGASGRYLELQTQIRGLADRYRACCPDTDEGWVCNPADRRRHPSATGNPDDRRRHPSATGPLS